MKRPVASRMRIPGTPKNSIHICLMLIFTLYSSRFTPVQAASANNLIKMEMHTAIDTRKTKVGSQFEVMTAEPVFFDKRTLPENTVLYGHIITIKPSRRLGRAAYFKVRFDSYAPPGHGPISLPTGENSQLTFQEDKNATAVHAVAKSMVLQHTSLLVSVPALIVFGISAPAFVLLDSSVDVVVGGSYGYRHKEPGDTRPTYQRVAGGIFRSVSSIPIASDLLHKSPDMVYVNGTQKAFSLPPAFLKAMMDTLPPNMASSTPSNSVLSSQTVPLSLFVQDIDTNKPPSPPPEAQDITLIQSQSDSSAWFNYLIDSERPSSQLSLKLNTPTQTNENFRTTP